MTVEAEANLKVAADLIPEVSPTIATRIEEAKSTAAIATPRASSVAAQTVKVDKL